VSDHYFPPRSPRLRGDLFFSDHARCRHARRSFTALSLIIGLLLRFIHIRGLFEYFLVARFCASCALSPCFSISAIIDNTATRNFFLTLPPPPGFDPIRPQTTPFDPNAESIGRGSQPIKHKTQRNLRCAAVRLFIKRVAPPPFGSDASLYYRSSFLSRNQIDSRLRTKDLAAPMPAPKARNY